MKKVESKTVQLQNSFMVCLYIFNNEDLVDMVNSITVAAACCFPGSCFEDCVGILIFVEC